jgi:CheY-like chemotaxis protein
MTTLSIVLAGLVLPAGLIACLMVTRRRTRPAQPPHNSTRHLRQERCVPDLQPVAREISESSRQTAAAPPASGRHILLVDDEREFAESAQSMLRQLGYRVTSMADANEALAFIRGANDRIDCLVTKLSMPGISGFDLARICQGLLRGIPIILMGSQEGPIAAELLDACGIHGLLSKPFTQKSLAAAVHRALTGGKDTAGS